METNWIEQWKRYGSENDMSCDNQGKFAHAA